MRSFTSLWQAKLIKGTVRRAQHDARRTDAGRVSRPFCLACARGPTRRHSGQLYEAVPAVPRCTKDGRLRHGRLCPARTRRGARHHVQGVRLSQEVSASGLGTNVLTRVCVYSRSYMQIPLSLVTSQLAFDSDQDAHDFLASHNAALYKTPNAPLAERHLDCKAAFAPLNEVMSKMSKADLKGQI